MPELVILVPSRGRPQNVARLIDACGRTCTGRTQLIFGFDDDDPRKMDNILAVTGPHLFTTGPRAGLAGWTNRLAAPYLLGDAPDPHLGSLGDDMVPVTPGWDRALMDACGTVGMAYPNDRRRTDIPEAIVMTGNIPRALGWMCEPSIDHWYTDNIWSDLGRGAGCITYLPDVLVEHRHPNVPGGDKPDGTYNDAAQRYSADLAAYQRWRLQRMARDVQTVRRLCAAEAHPV